MAKAAFKKFIGYYIGAIVLLLHLAGFVFLIVYGLGGGSLKLEARDCILFIAALMGLIGVFYSQYRFDKRQQKDHQNQSERENEDRLLDKKEEAILLSHKAISKLQSIHKKFNDELDYPNQLQPSGTVDINKITLDVLGIELDLLMFQNLIYLYFSEINDDIGNIMRNDLFELKFEFESYVSNKDDNGINLRSINNIISLLKILNTKIVILDHHNR